MIRRAAVDDLAVVVAMRCAMWSELNPHDPSDEGFEARVRAYYAGALGAPNVAVWLALDGEGTVAGMVTLLEQQHPPRKDHDELRGYVTAMFVTPSARRRGHGRALLDALLAHARARRMRRVLLRTTDAARALYGAASFRILEHLALDLA